ncbi:MAG: EpsI family protein [Gemmatimonadota bacterium]|jgi:EpsI family protein
MNPLRQEELPIEPSTVSPAREIGTAPSRPGPTDGGESGRPGPASGLLAAGGLAVLLLAYLPTTIRSFHPVWWGWYTHGYPIAALCLYLLWREGRRLDPRTRGWWLALVPVAALSALWLVAWVLSVQVVHQAVLPLLVACAATVVYGGSGLRIVAPIAATFLLAVPLWETLTRPLQLLTVAATETLLAVVGLEATVRGETITIPYGTFLVADTCAGLSYLMVALFIGAVYAWLFLRSWPARIAVVALAAAVAIVGNWIRVFSLVVIGYRTEMTSPLVESHGTYGWVVFGFSLVVFFVLARRIERWGAVAPQGGAAPPARWPAETPGPRGFRSRILAAVAAGVVGPLLYLVVSSLPADRTVPEETPGLQPAPGWTSTPGAPGAAAGWRPDFQGADERIVHTWRRGDEVGRVDRLVYLEQRQGKELVGGENRIAPDGALLGSRLLGPVGPDERTVQEAVVEVEGERRLVWWWYVVTGQVTTSSSTAKLLGLEGFVRREPVAELVAASVPCPTGDCAEAVPTLASLVMGIRVQVEAPEGPPPP